MSEITPELIAQLATRIYRETRADSTAAPTELVDEIPSQPPALSPPISTRAAPAGGAPQLPNAQPRPGASAWPEPPMSIASNPWSIGLAQQPAALSRAPAPTPSRIPPTSANPTANDGLRAFVQQVRTAGVAPHGTAPAPFATDLHARLAGLKAAAPAGSRPYDVQAVRQDFPILHQSVHGKPLVWLDNAATTQKPRVVIDALKRFYERDNSNIHRGAHTLAARATDAYEHARQRIQTFLGASSEREIVFVRGTTEGINLVAQTCGRHFLQPGDEIVLTQLEHHANIVPWQMVAKERGAVLRVAPVNDHGEILLGDYERLLGQRTRLVAMTHASNSLGTILPIEEMTYLAKRHGARVLIDGAQSVAHLPINLQQLPADFFVFSGHKIFGPTGIGAVFIRQDLHELLPPWQGGGNMIRNVTFEETTYSEAPAKFEAGTPNIADAVGLAAALDYVESIGLPRIAAHEHELLLYGTEQLSRIPGLRLIGTAREKVGVLSFVLPNRPTEEVGRLLDQEGIAVRSGHHCAQPSLRRFGVEATVRPSLSLYNTRDDIDRLVAAVARIRGT